MVSKSVLDTLYSVKKCLIDSLSVLFQVLRWSSPFCMSGATVALSLFRTLPPQIAAAHTKPPPRACPCWLLVIRGRRKE